ncbi:MAG: tetratricopeptide repeat protein [Oligoflexales bacterium]
MKYYSLLLMFLFFSACAGSYHEEQMQGILIKKKNIKPFYKDKQLWLSEFESKDGILAKIIQTIEKKEWKQSIHMARNYLKKNPFNKGCFLVLATSYAGLGKYEKASYYAKLVLKKFPTNVAAINILGLSIYSRAELLEDYRKAQRIFQLAFERSDREVAAGLNLGYLLLEMGDAQSAQKIFVQTSNRCGGCEESKLGYAISLRRQGKHNLAKETLEVIVAKNPAFMTAWYQLALHYRNVEKNYEKSSQFIRKILDQSDMQDIELVEKARMIWYANKENVVL